MAMMMVVPKNFLVFLWSFLSLHSDVSWANSARATLSPNATVA